jgi:hypothetical protein
MGNTPKFVIFFQIMTPNSKSLQEQTFQVAIPTIWQEKKLRFCSNFPPVL